MDLETLLPKEKPITKDTISYNNWIRIKIKNFIRKHNLLIMKQENKCVIHLDSQVMYMGRNGQATKKFYDCMTCEKIIDRYMFKLRTDWSTHRENYLAHQKISVINKIKDSTLEKISQN